MLAVRTGRAARPGERDGDGDPLVDVLFALSASTGVMITLFALVVGELPLVAVACVAIVAAHVARLQRLGLVGAVLVWLHVLAAAEGFGVITPLLMIGACGALVIGPGRVLDWAEERWAIRAERTRLERQAELAAELRADGIDAVGWIEELPTAPARD
jgi:hypothetical protein